MPPVATRPATIGQTKRVPRKVHERCGKVHALTAKCEDGWRDPKYERGAFSSTNNPKKPKPVVEPVAEPLVTEKVADDLDKPIEVNPGVPETVIAGDAGESGGSSTADETIGDQPGAPATRALTADEQLELAQFRAQKEHDEAEKKAGMKLPLPAILRDMKEKRSDEVLAQVNTMIRNAKKDAPGIPTADKNPEMTRDRNRQKPELTDAQEREALAEIMGERAAGKPGEIVVDRPQGEATWKCGACRTRFTSMSIDAIRKWAKDNPGKRLGCPECGSTKVSMVAQAA